VPETNRHLELRTALYLIVKRAFARTATVGSDQFVYYDPTTAKKKLAPDVFVRLGAPHQLFDSWKVWERGAPDLAVEIVSPSDEPEEAWEEKAARYRASGIREVVRFDPNDSEAPIRVWDLVDGDLVERAPDDPNLRMCEALDLWWMVVVDKKLGPMLRLTRDREGKDLLPTDKEAEAAARKAARAARAGEKAARDEAERLAAEVAALKAQLGKAKAKKPAKR
jgi:hypothetical protein